ncbi:hypothetical protein BC829DRAFT_276782 [Chytridium lagenaria]|nr:hypothetical protein BC829DRAFT_276782 [Chytridium lagenaria]
MGMVTSLLFLINQRPVRWLSVSWGSGLLLEAVKGSIRIVCFYLKQSPSSRLERMITFQIFLSVNTGRGTLKSIFSRRPTSYDTTFSEATHKAVKSKRAQNGSYGYKGDPVLTVDERLSMARSFEKLASVKNSLLSLATPEIPMHLGTAGLEVRASVSTFEHPFYDERDLPLPPNIEVSEPLSPAVDLRRKSIAIRELRDSTSLKWLHEASKASLGKVSVGDEKRRRGVVEGADMFSNSWIPLYVLDHWQHIGKWSLLFLDSDMREKYRLFVRSDGGAYLKALFREGASAAIISSGIITIAILHTLFADDAGRMPSSVRLEYIAKNTVLRQYSPWIGIYSAVGFFTAQMFVCWLQHFLCRRRLDRIIRRVADETHTAVDTAALGSWGAYWLKIITTAGVIISIQLTTFGHVWLFPQAGMQLFLAFVANLEHQYLDSDMPFHYFMVAIVVMTVVPMTTLFFLKVAGMVDLIETFALTAIVLSGKYRHSLAKKTSFLFQLTLVTSRELQDLESAFFFELLGAILPHRVIESMFSDTRNESTLERFKEQGSA